MWSLFKKVKNKVESEARILEDFIHSRTQFLRAHTPRKERVPHLPGQKIAKEKDVITYRITEEECESLKEHFLPGASIMEGESDQSFFGKVIHKERLLGFYLGKSYKHDTYWARFWLE